MQTYSHFLMTAVGGAQLRERGVAISTVAVLVGSVLPDLPFTVLTLVYSAYYTWFAALPVSGQNVMEYLHFDLYFNDPLWIAAHNFFHAPLILLLIGGIGWWAQQHGQRWGWGLFWFALGAGLHTLIDIATHHNDGPLLLFPFDWTLRFSSPISYWDPEHYGLIFAPLEHLLDVALLIYLFLLWRRRRRLRSASQLMPNSKLSDR